MKEKKMNQEWKEDRNMWEFKGVECGPIYWKAACGIYSIMGSAVMRRELFL